MREPEDKDGGLEEESDALGATPTHGDDGPTTRALIDRLESERASVRLPPMLGRFEVGHCLGRGGEGRVFRARDTKLDRTVALKVLASSADAESNLLREARAAVRGRHRAFVEVYGVENIGGHTVLVMELVSGQSLKSRLSSRNVHPDSALEWGIELADALAALHSVNVLHCDIKPSNVLVDEQGRARLIDFGIADTPEDVEPHSRGTPAYMAPEQARAASCPQSDIFSLGLLLLEAILGGRPERVAGAVVIGRKERDAIAAGVGSRRARQFSAVLAKATDPDPARRFSSARQFTNELIRLRTSPKTWARRLALGAGLILCGILVSYLVVQRTPTVTMIRLTPGTLGPLITDASLAHAGESIVWRESDGSVRVAKVSAIDVSRPPAPIGELPAERFALSGGRLLFLGSAGPRAIDFSGRDAPIEGGEAFLPLVGPFAIGPRGVAWGESRAVHFHVGNKSSVVELARPELRAGEMSFSPSGDELAFLECETGTLLCALKTTDAAGQVSSVWQADDLGDGVAWSDAGLFFTRHDRSNDGRRGVLMLARGGARSPREVGTWDDATVRVVSASRDGRLALVLRSRATWETSIVDLKHAERGPTRLELDSTARVSELGHDHVYLTRSLPTVDEAIVLRRSSSTATPLPLSHSEKGSMLVNAVTASTGMLLAIRLGEEANGVLSARLVERRENGERTIRALGRGRHAAWAPPPLWARVRCGTALGAPCILGSSEGTALQFSQVDLATGETRSGRRLEGATHDMQLGWSLDAKGERIAWPDASKGVVYVGSVANSSPPAALEISAARRAFRTAWLPGDSSLLVAIAGEDTMDRPLVTVPLERPGTTSVLTRFAHGMPSYIAVDPSTESVAVSVAFPRRDLWLVCIDRKCPK